LKKIYLLKSIVVIVFFLVYKYSKNFYAYVIFGENEWNNSSIIFRSALILFTGVLLAFSANYIINKRLSFKDFGINRQGFVKSLVAAILFSSPMFLILGFANNFNFSLTYEIILKDLLLAGFGEEFIYRAFLFGLLFYFAGWGFLSAGIFAGLFFGIGHIYQAHDVWSGIFIFLFTTGVSLGFAWFYHAWNTLWFAVFLHGFMDLIWDMFQVDSNVTGNLMVNLARIATLILAVLYSLRMAKKKGRLNLGPQLWVNKTN